MAATFQFSESNGAGEVVTDGISNINFGSIDSPDLVPSANLILRGESSFEKYIRGLFTGVFNEISNMKFWKSSGVFVTGESIKASQPYAPDYATPSEVANADDDVPEDSGAALILKSAEGGFTIVPGSGVSGYTGYIRLQLQSTILTPAGDVNEKEFTLQYDEN